MNLSDPFDSMENLHMKNRLCFVLLILAFVGGTMKAVERPNIVFIFTDDQRADAVGTLGNPDVKTPHIDRLINEGTLFTQAYIQGSMN